MTIRLAYDKIPNGWCIPETANHSSGATVVFLGTAREVTNGRVTRELQYDAYPEMAERLMQHIEQEAFSKWPILECQITHRLGRIPLGETCVVVRVASGHRRTGFCGRSLDHGRD